MKYRVGITDYVKAPYDVEAKAFPNVEYVFLNSEDLDDFDQNVLAELDALLVWHAHIGERAAIALKKSCIVVRYGVGYDSIDIAALSKEGIPFCNTPDYGTEEVADTTVALLLHHLRRIPEYSHNCRHYEFGWQEHTLSPQLRSNRTVIGVVGVGRIGMAVINRLKSFGFRILGYDPYQPSGHEKAVGYERRHSLYDMLAECDAVTLHCPLRDETRGIVDDKFILSVKPGCILVNTARGGLVKSLDILQTALSDGMLAGICLDVLPVEPPPDHPLITAWRDHAPWIKGRLTITPHTAYFSDQAWYEMRFKAAETVRMFFDDGTLQNLGESTDR